MITQLNLDLSQWLHKLLTKNNSCQDFVCLSNSTVNFITQDFGIIIKYIINIRYTYMLYKQKIPVYHYTVNEFLDQF